ncbi:MAG: hypothetical protein U0T74_10260 [Chitinophagales bacterium]
MPKKILSIKDQSLMRRISFMLCITAVILFAGCKKESKTPKLIFKFKLDPTQERLNNLGLPASMPTGHAGQNPNFNSITAHYLEMAPSAFTQIGDGTVLYHASETTAGGATAIDFSKSTLVSNNGTFLEVPLTSVAAGEYEYLRVSLAYQNYDVNLYIDTNFGGFPIQQEVPSTIASFVGYNTYISSYKIKDETVVVNDDKLQGYWGYELNTSFYGYPYKFHTTGQAPPGATTVVNPIASTSPIPAGSCVVTGPFSGGKLKITGNETDDVVVVVSLSTNKSFEWIDVVPDGKWEPLKGETIVDMGLRGMIPTVQ